MTQTVIITASGGSGNVRGTFNNITFTLSVLVSQSRGAIPVSREFQVEAGTVQADILASEAGGSRLTMTITNNGHVIDSFTANRDAGMGSRRISPSIQIEELEAITPPTIEPTPPEEETFIFANIFRLSGDPPVKILVSSGKISQASADALAATGHIIELISEGEVAPPKFEVTPQDPFFIDRNGNKVFLKPKGLVLRINIKESLGFKEVG